jgi:hypothetical protein
MGREVRRLSATEFDEAVASTRISAKNVMLAKAVLVDGLPVGAVADDVGITHQAVSGLVGRIWNIYCRLNGLPPDWRRVTVTVPQAMAETIESMAAKAASELRGGRNIAATAFSHERKLHKDG